MSFLSRLASWAGVGCILVGAAAHAQDFSVGGFSLSSGFSTDDGEYWDAEGNHRTWTVSKLSAEPVGQYTINVSIGTLDGPVTETHRLHVLTTLNRQAYVIDFS